MNDWKEQLNKKAQDLGIENKINFKKEEQDGQIISSARIIDRNNYRSSRNVHRISIHKEIITDKGGGKVITVEGALKDLEAIETEAKDEGAKSVVKALKVVIKFLSTMRSNQLLTEEEKVKIREARKAREEKEVKK